MEKGSTLVLRGAVGIIGLAVFAICALALPTGIRDMGLEGYGLILLGLYVPAVPFFVALYQAMKLLDFIDTNKAFSDLSVDALNVIKYCAVIISLLFVAGMPYIYHVANLDDAPGVVLIGLVIIGASFTIATFAALLQKLLHNAIEIKSENELTV